jgi:alpha-tubulin suppressor-like RCC1 family protein
VKRGVAAALLVPLALACACSSSDEEELTELVVAIDSDLAVPQQADDVELEITGASGAAQRIVGPLAGPGALTLPVTLSLTSETGGAPLSIRVSARFQGEPIVVREVRTSFLTGQRRLLSLPLARACLDVTCAAGQTCASDGKCVAPELAAEALPPFSGALPERLLSGPGGAGVASLAPGGAHTCARTANARVVCWGNNDALALGTSAPLLRTAPRVVKELVDVEDLASSVGYSCATTKGRDLFCWGANDSGQLGSGAAGAPVPRPTAVTGLPPVVKVAAGQGHACAIATDGGVFCWGANDHGQLGDGTTTAHAAPAKLTLPAAASAVALGKAHSCALLVTGEVDCWGATVVADVLIPRRVLDDGKALGAGAFHTCVVRADRTVACWGQNGLGQLGDNKVSGDLSELPVPVTGLTGARDVATGENHTCARTEAGIVSCWGANDSGQIGDGSKSNRFMPVLARLSGAVDELSAGVRHTCARRAQGPVRCWGRNDGGQLGDGTTEARLSPTTVIGLP